MKGLVSTTVWVVLAAACNSSRPNTVAPGELFAGPYISVKAPASAEWQLQDKSDTGITFATGEVGDTYIASVRMFRLPPAATPEAFESLIREGAARDRDPNDPDRYELLGEYVAYSSERPYPCVRYRSLLRDNVAKGTKDPQFLELDGLYCRHPMDPTAGAVIMYSHRGLSRHAALRQEAERFIENAHLIAE